MALSIAGSDPSGGAGIQADLKTFTALGVYGGAAITCLTVQNSQGVVDFTPCAPELVKNQVEAVLADLPVTHVKTGMIGTPEIAQAIAAALKDFQGELICDPVLTASSGLRLFQAKDAAWLLPLLQRATVLTPNLPELSALTNSQPKNAREAVEAARSLLAALPNLRAVALTGGHLREDAPEVEDFLIRRSGTGAEVIRVAHPRLDTRNTHGTGCTFASAFTACHLLSGDDEQAFRGAVEFLASLLAASADLNLGRGQGGLAHHLWPGRASQPGKRQ
ncbi:MAG: bifunctional hydroxymethylpyrimidine kinase/phosphomethylpyrimidine kinase [Thermodesulfobacteriota bacterium]